MHIYINPSINPAFNLALEEYALTSLRQPLIILWQNHDAVIIGRNQNTWAEVNLSYAFANNIEIARRFTGGGAVFHDLGNINYTLVQAGKLKNEDFNQPLCAYLRGLGLQVEAEGRNDLLLDGCKFCGQAGADKNGWSMQHGCILFNSDLTRLSRVLKPPPAKFTGKKVDSVTARVTNLAPFLQHPMDSQAFISGLADFFIKTMPGLNWWQPSPEVLLAIEQLAASKYATWPWNFGYSPTAKRTISRKFPFGLVEIYMTVKKGIINDIAIFGDFFGDKSRLENTLTGLRLEHDSINEALSKLELEQCIKGMNHKQLLSMLL